MLKHDKIEHFHTYIFDFLCNFLGGLKLQISKLVFLIMFRRKFKGGENATHMHTNTINRMFWIQRNSASRLRMSLNSAPSILSKNVEYILVKFDKIKIYKHIFVSFSNSVWKCFPICKFLESIYYMIDHFEGNLIFIEFVIITFRFWDYWGLHLHFLRFFIQYSLHVHRYP